MARIDCVFGYVGWVSRPRFTWENWSVKFGIDLTSCWKWLQNIEHWVYQNSSRISPTVSVWFEYKESLPNPWNSDGKTVYFFDADGDFVEFVNTTFSKDFWGETRSAWICISPSLSNCHFVLVMFRMFDRECQKWFPESILVSISDNEMSVFMDSEPC